MQCDDHLLTVLRYVQRNPLRAKLVRDAGGWRWSGLWRRLHGDPRSRELLCPWPVEPPADWAQWVQQPQTAAEEEALRTSVHRGRPFGAGSWQERITRELGLESSFRRPGRPSKDKGVKA